MKAALRTHETGPRGMHARGFERAFDCLCPAVAEEYVLDVTRAKCSDLLSGLRRDGVQEYVAAQCHKIHLPVHSFDNQRMTMSESKNARPS